ncbi:MAG: hypothetical protein LQ342_003401 [Letrouitia transgressa]|nr:MAG: hypothetical protein LQ342_003401 [Letrouitia transgressa]
MSGAVAVAKNLTLPSGIEIFYRKAGDPFKPTILLLHGFPSSSHQFRNLLALLAVSYHVVAPDLPGFGFTIVPPALDYTYTFGSLANTTTEFLDALKISKFSVYVFDYGAPTAFRIALQRPEAISTIVSQNGNAYDEGLQDFWDPIRELWRNDTLEIRKQLADSLFSPATTKAQYTNGVTSLELLKQIPPETYTLDQALLERPGQTDIQLSFFKDYETNVKLYPAIQEYFRKSGVPVLAIWGKNDDIFVYDGAKAFAKDVKDFRLVGLETGHFALETHAEVIAEETIKWLKKHQI